MLLAGALLAIAPPAAASDGSVPPEVAAYASDPDGLLARLTDLFGPDADGRGIEFDETTKAGQLNRAFVFTEAYLAGESSRHPIELVNEWTAPISIAEQPVGLAVIWINQTTIDPELADFTADPDLAIALSDVPADAALVHDADRAAWFALTGNELVALVPGTSGVSDSTTLGRYQQRLVDAAAGTQSAEAGVPTPAILVIVASLLVIVGVLVWTPVAAWMRRRRAAASTEPEPGPTPEPEPEPEPKPEPAPVAAKAPRKRPAPKPAPAPEPEPEPEPAPKPPRKRPAPKPKPEPEPVPEAAPKPPRKRPAPKPKAPKPEPELQDDPA